MGISPVNLTPSCRGWCLVPAHFAEEESEAPELSDLLSLEVANQDMKLATAYHAGTGRKDLDMASPSAVALRHQKKNGALPVDT